MPLPNRREVLTGITAASALALLSSPSRADTEPPPETKTVRLPSFFPAGCEGPQYIAEALLRAEGFDDVQMVVGDTAVDASIWLARGEIDFDWNYAATHIGSIEAGIPLTVLTGLHSGCLELVANKRVNSVTELRGKKVGVYSLSSSPHVLLTLMAHYIGLDPGVDFEWVTDKKVSPKDLFIDGKIDAFLATPPEPQDLRARKVGHTILATNIDRPWSQYYCCMLAGHADYVAKNPVATKRAMRALLKAIDICSANPRQVAKELADGKLVESYDYALELLSDARYDRWRDFDPEDTLRFYALRMQETGLIKSNPQEIIAKGTDWRILNELRRELKT